MTTTTADDRLLDGTMWGHLGSRMDMPLHLMAEAAEESSAWVDDDVMEAGHVL